MALNALAKEMYFVVKDTYLHIKTKYGQLEHEFHELTLQFHLTDYFGLSVILKCFGDRKKWYKRTHLVIITAL